MEASVFPLAPLVLNKDRIFFMSSSEKPRQFIINH